MRFMKYATPSDLFQAFFYDWIDRNAYKKGKPLPDKIGSMQIFMNGFQGKSRPFSDASRRRLIASEMPRTS